MCSVSGVLGLVFFCFAPHLGGVFIELMGLKGFVGFITFTWFRVQDLEKVCEQYIIYHVSID